LSRHILVSNHHANPYPPPIINPTISLDVPPHTPYGSEHGAQKAHPPRLIYMTHSEKIFYGEFIYIHIHLLFYTPVIFVLIWGGVFILYKIYGCLCVFCGVLWGYLGYKFYKKIIWVFMGVWIRYK
jgi:hypothetical protein